jgi:Ca2+-binding RTX toxin-like protein
LNLGAGVLSFGTGGSVQHQYKDNRPDNAAYTISVTVTDKDGASNATPATAAVTVNNVAPTPTITGAPASGTVGTAITLGSTVSDPSTLDTAQGFTYAWSVTGGAFSSTGNNNSASFAFTPSAGGIYVVTLMVTDKDGGSTSTSKTISVTGNQNATNLAFAQQPTTTIAGQTIPVTVRIEDSNGHLVSSNAPVTIALASNPGGATLGGTLTVNAVNGVATFTDLALDLPGTGYTLKATSGTLTSATSNAFNSTLPTTAVSVIGNQLYVVSGSASDAVVIDPVGPSTTGSTGVNVKINGQSTPITQSIGLIRAYLQGGNDTFQMNTSLTVSALVVAGDGNVNVKTAGGNDSVIAGNGNDTISVGGGNNLVTAGNGNDVVTAANGNNTIKLGDGNDVVQLGNGNATVTLGKKNNTVTAGSGNVSVTAGDGNNTVSLGTGSDVVILGKGNNTVTLGGGNNAVTLGGGNNNVTTGAGNDFITVGNGNNNVSAGAGYDVIVAGNGNNSLDGGAGNDLIAGGLGKHTISGGAGNDILIDGSVAVTPQKPNDSLRKILSDWVTYGATAANMADIRSRIAVTYSTGSGRQLTGGTGNDWFFYLVSSPPQNDRVVSGPGAENLN